MEEIDFDERLNELPNNYEEKEEKNKDVNTTIDYGQSINAKTNRKSLGLKTWNNLRSEMADGYRNDGVFKGTLKAIGIIALSVISLTVTLSKYLLTHEAEPYNYEEALSQRADKRDMKEHNKAGKREQKEREIVNEQSNDKSEQEKENKRDYINDNTKIKNAINKLRNIETINKDNGKSIDVKTIAGIKYIGYSAKTGNMMFYSKDKKTIELPINTVLLKTVGLTNQIAEIFNKKALQEYKENASVGISVEQPIDQNTADKIKMSSYIKATMLVGAINMSLDTENNVEKIASSVINGHKITLEKYAAFNMQPTDETKGWKPVYAEGDININILVDGEKKDTISATQLTDIKPEIIDDIISNLNINVQVHEQNNVQIEYVSTPGIENEYEQKEYSEETLENDCDMIKEMIDEYSEEALENELDIIKEMINENSEIDIENIQDDEYRELCSQKAEQNEQKNLEMAEEQNIGNDSEEYEIEL